MSPIFIVSTGRCGSKFVSAMLQEHPDVLSLTGFFSALIGRAFPPQALGGPEFWGIVSARRRDVENLLRKGASLQHYYQYPYETGRFNLSTGLPAPMYLMLPQLTDDPERLYDDLAAVVPQWPRRPVVDHYRQLFQWLAQRVGGSVVVERSGQSITWIDQLRTAFPDARFVHMYRNGPDCALALSTAPASRLWVFLWEATRIAGVPPGTPLSSEQLRRLPDWLARVVAGDYNIAEFMSDSVPLTWFGQVWADQTLIGLTELGRLPSSMWISIDYDSLLSDPVREFTKLAEFLGVEPSRRWLQTAVGRVDPTQAGAARRLDDAVRAELEQACAAGATALRLLETGRFSEAIDGLARRASCAVREASHDARRHDQMPCTEVR